MASTGVTIDMIRNDNRTFTLTFTDENGAAIDISSIPPVLYQWTSPDSEGNL